MKPWVRMYREERGTFAQLPLVCRGIAMEILKLTDDEGVIRIGRKNPIDAIGFALGATRSDRRALAQYVPMLIEDGFLVHDDDRLVVPGFPKFQGDDRGGAEARQARASAAIEQQTDRDRATNRARPSNELSTVEQRTDHEEWSKSPKSAGGTDVALSLNREEQKRQEKSREEKRARSTSVEVRHVAPDAGAVTAGNSQPRVAPTPAATAPVERMLRSLEPGTEVEARVSQLVSQSRQAAGGAPYRATGHHDRETVVKLARWAADPAIGIERLGEALAAFWRAKGTGARLSWLVDEDPGRFLGTPKGRRSHVVSAGTQAEHDAVVAAAGGEGYANVQL